ncbi:A-kinase anchor protein SPHKAP [Manis javanica]|nr:A-kinase anchor protein SPHKAP [Manis javanica]
MIYQCGTLGSPSAPAGLWHEQCKVGRLGDMPGVTGELVTELRLYHAVSNLKIDKLANCGSRDFSASVITIRSHLQDEAGDAETRAARSGRKTNRKGGQDPCHR